MKGIVLAGGNGSRLHPITKGVTKQLLPIYDKPMVYYPISILMIAGIQRIAIISDGSEIHRFKQLLGDGSDFGVSFEFIEQSKPGGIAEAFLLSKDFIENDSVTLILGDNIFYGTGLKGLIESAIRQNIGATIFAHRVNDPSQFGVVNFDNDGAPVSIVEKPKASKSKYAVTGLYVYDNDVIDIAASLTPSDRGELEITDVNINYLSRKKLNVQILGRGYSWLDAGTHDSLLEAGKFVQIIEKRQGLKIACLEEIAYYNGWLSGEQIKTIGNMSDNTSYGQYLLSIADGK